MDACVARRPRRRASSSSERPRVFERFYRGVDDGDGFGLGLAIVAEAVRAIDGELELDSDEEGTGVSISLPAAHLRK